MFNTKINLETLRRKYAQLQEECKRYQAENEALKERLDKISKGERCMGEYCKSCKQMISGTTFEYTTVYGETVTIGGGQNVCALSVPCPDFERED